MADKVVLVRHGTAERRGLHASDIDRKLTVCGRWALTEAYRQEEFFPSLLAGDDEPSAVTVVASPATRAMQTAEIICDVLGLPAGGIIKTSTLWNQDVRGIEGMILGTSDTVVVVGHSPSIDDVASYLSGRMRSMLRGEALCIDLRPIDRGSGVPGQVMWDCRPK